MGQSEPSLLSYCLTKKLRNTSFLQFLLLLFIQSGDTYKFSLSHFQLFFKEYVWWRCKLLIMYIIWNKRKNNAQLTSTAWKVSVFGVFLVCTFPYLDSIRGDTPCFFPYSVRMWENTDPKNYEYRNFSRSVLHCTKNKVFYSGNCGFGLI